LICLDRKDKEKDISQEQKAGYKWITTKHRTVYERIITWKSMDDIG
jgi:hypothetical protein